jgi:hypothetical protein
MQERNARTGPARNLVIMPMLEGEALQTRIQILCAETKLALEGDLLPKEHAKIALRAVVLEYFASLIEAGQANTNADLAALCKEHSYNFARDFLAPGSMKAVRQNMFSNLPQTIFDGFSRLQLQQGIAYGRRKSAIWGEELKVHLSTLLEEARTASQSADDALRSKLLVRTIVLDYLAEHPNIDSTGDMERLLGVRSRYLASSFLKIKELKPLTSFMAERLPLDIFHGISIDDLYKGISFSSNHTVSAQVAFAKRLNDFALRVEGPMLQQKKHTAYQQLVTRSEALQLLHRAVISHPGWTSKDLLDSLNAGQPYDAQISISTLCKFLYTRNPITHHMAFAIERLSGATINNLAGIYITHLRRKESPRITGAALLKRIESIMALSTDALRQSALEVMYDKACQLLQEHEDDSSKVHIRSLAAALNVRDKSLQSFLKPSSNCQSISNSFLISLNNASRQPLQLVSAPAPQAPLREEKYFSRLRDLLETCNTMEQLKDKDPSSKSQHIDALHFLLEEEDRLQGIRSAADLARRTGMSKSQIQLFLSPAMPIKALPPEIIALLPASQFQQLHTSLAASLNKENRDLCCARILSSDRPQQMVKHLVASLQKQESLDALWLQQYTLVEQLLKDMPHEASLFDCLAVMKQKMSHDLTDQSQCFERTILNKGVFFQDRWTKLMSEPIQGIAAIDQDAFPVFCALKLQRLNELLEKDHRGQYSQLYLAERSRGEARLTMQFLAAVGYTYKDTYETYAASLHATIAAYKQIMFLDIRGYALSVSDRMPPVRGTGGH